MHQASCGLCNTILSIVVGCGMWPTFKCFPRGKIGHSVAACENDHSHRGLKWLDFQVRDYRIAGDTTKTVRMCMKYFHEQQCHRKSMRKYVRQREKCFKLLESLQNEWSERCKYISVEFTSIEFYRVSEPTKKRQDISRFRKTVDKQTNNDAIVAAVTATSATEIQWA